MIIGIIYVGVTLYNLYNLPEWFDAISGYFVMVGVVLLGVSLYPYDGEINVAEFAVQLKDGFKK